MKGTTVDMTYRATLAASQLQTTDPAALADVLRLAARWAEHPDDESTAVEVAMVNVAERGIAPAAAVRVALRSAAANRRAAWGRVAPAAPDVVDVMAERATTDDRAAEAEAEAVRWQAARAALSSSDRAVVDAITGHAISAHAAHLAAMAEAGQSDPGPWCKVACANLTGRAVMVRCTYSAKAVAAALGHTGGISPATWAAVRAAAARAAVRILAAMAGRTLSDTVESRRAYRAARYAAATNSGGTVLLAADGGNVGSGVPFMGGRKAAKASPRGERLAPVFPWVTYASPLAAAAVSDPGRMFAALSALLPDVEWEHFQTVVAVSAPERAASAAPLARLGYSAPNAGEVGAPGPSTAYGTLPGVGEDVMVGAGQTFALAAVDHLAATTSRAASRAVSKAEATYAALGQRAAAPCPRVMGEAAPVCGCDVAPGTPLREVKREQVTSGRRLPSHFHHDPQAVAAHLAAVAEADSAMVAAAMVAREAEAGQ